MLEPDWRTRHCAELAVDAVKQATGRDIWKELGGCPRSWREGKELYERVGATCLADVVTAVLGAPVEPETARIGDICMVDGALGVVRAPGAVECFNGYVPVERASYCWRAR